jgi:DNA-directed RNA polymerase specialized sigma24 family protein
MRAGERETVPPCRVLMRDGVACDEVITERQRPAPCEGMEDRGELEADAVRPRRPTRRKTGPSAEVVRRLRAEGYTVAQIAERTGCSIQTVWNRLKEEA